METGTTMALSTQPAVHPRSKAPVFVLGCGRSGTTLLYHMLLSAGNFAVYRVESNVINLLEPRFGDLSVHRNQRRLLDAWYGSRLYTLSGLDKPQVEKRVADECRNGGDFLRIIMEEMARKQGVERWADTTPEHLLHLPRIKQTIPSALIIHIIRDGRDVALSTEKLGYIRPLPWDRRPPPMAAGLYWEWMVNKGRRDGKNLGGDYIEVHFEELIAHPQETLTKLSQFIDQELDYKRIQEVGIGSVSAPNTSFKSGEEQQQFSPLGRWKSGYSSEDLAALEGLIGGTLEELGYELATKDSESSRRASLRRMRAMYRAYFDGKLFLKAKTPLGQMFVTRDLSWI
jgi:Sulfotransferase family